MARWHSEAKQNQMLTEHERENLAAHNGVLTCENCGKTGDDVIVGFDPYDDEINDALVPVVLCTKCFLDSQDDI